LTTNGEKGDNAGWYRAIALQRLPEDRMATILPFLREQTVFDPETIQAMSSALEQACRTLNLRDDATREREVVAVRIIELARRGEHDAARLCRRVLSEAGAA
jgi:hypothetical protein